MTAAVARLTYFLKFDVELDEAAGKWVSKVFCITSDYPVFGNENGFLTLTLFNPLTSRFVMYNT